ncbi:TPA: hypothetical protein I7264_25790 [Vibrio parahaemolyticus]|nr:MULTISPECIES: hypothetical protein [Vibrio]EGQ8527897.1 hypothetical protein [Vibrio parahaemolyticus]EGQ9211932.1 hypothetical protein [Vibrio parahaemolyticus]EGQ9245486.1 hypothetical protein [Vibrio parahaemolyticus]EGQ9789658.1 hypothetical protein [Vibrio parahaemolyticus]EGQ9926396.1 hypothetical protein [Vibrio parahaemolyticus]
MSINMFEPIKLKKVIDEQSRRYEDTALYEIVIELSARAPQLWQDIFNNLWKRNLYMMKRNAIANSYSITITCVPDELQQSHVPELKRVVEQTNNEYQSYLAQKAQHEAEMEAQATAEKEKLKKLSNDISFD